MAIKVVEKMKNKQIVYGTVINYATVFVQMISTVVVTPYFDKNICDNDYGIYKIIVSVSGIFDYFKFWRRKHIDTFFVRIESEG